MKKVVFICFISIFTISNFGFCNTFSKSQALKISELFIKFVSKDDFESASKLLHYPNEYTEEQLESDIKGVSAIMQSLDHSFGEIISYKEATGMNVVASIGGGTADIPYWKKYSESKKLTLEASFSKYGNGYLEFVFYNINGELGLRAVNYGLPASSTESIKLLKQASKPILEILKK